MSLPFPLLLLEVPTSGTTPLLLLRSWDDGKLDSSDGIGAVKAKRVASWIGGVLGLE